MRARPSLLAALLALASPPYHAPVRAAATPSPTLPQLRVEQQALSARLKAAVERDPLASRVLGARADVVMAIRTDFVESLLAEVAHQYFDDVVLDLKAVRANADGEVHSKTPFGRIKVGEWRLATTVESLRGRLQAGHPRLRLAQDRLEVDVPVVVRPAPGRIALAFEWDSSGLANVVCRDFELARVLEGRVVGQQHRLEMVIRLASGDGFLSATPELADRGVKLRVDLTPESWAAVERELSGQDRLARCGMLLKPERVLAELHALAARGIEVRLPDELLRSVRLPTQFAQEVQLGTRSVELLLRRPSLRVDGGLVWSTARVSAKAEARQPGDEPGASRARPPGSA
jgi:hypothetical protein